MKSIERKQINRFQRQSTFLAENAADFPPSSPQGLAIIIFNEEISRILALAARQVSGLDTKSQHHTFKDLRVDQLHEAVKQITLAARAMKHERPGIEDKFRLPRKGNEQALLASARSFVTDAEPFKAKFIECGLAEDFLDELNGLITAFEAVVTSVNVAASIQTEATGGLEDAFLRTKALSNQLDSFVKIKYRGNPAKLAAWKSASHLERAPKREKKKPTIAGETN